MTANDLPDLDRRAAELLNLTIYERVDQLDYFSAGKFKKWHPTQSSDQAAMLEREIEKRGLQANYVGELEARCPLSGDASEDAWTFWLITTPPAARVAAAVEVLEDK